MCVWSDTPKPEGEDEEEEEGPGQGEGEGGTKGEEEVVMNSIAPMES